MYALKPVFRVPADLHVTCPMYKLKNLHEQPTVAADQPSFDRDFDNFELLSDQEKEVLLKKQNEVLNVLKQLELRLKKLSIHSYDTKDNELIPEKQSIVSTSSIKESELEADIDITNFLKDDIVVFADPEKPPYSLLALPVLWPTVSWDISYHVHSTITKDLKELETIKLFKNVSSKDKKRTVKVLVIWQHIDPSPKIMRSPTDVVIGEASLLWLFNTFLAPEASIRTDQTNSDKVMALINEISFSKIDRTSELYNIINDSTKMLDVENVAVWSLLFKNNKIPEKIEKWIEQLTKLIVH